MKTSLPKFEGEQVKAAKLNLTGNSHERVGALARNEEVYLIVRGVVSHVDHGDADGVLTRTHKVKATSAILMDRDEGARILDEAAMLADERFGIQSLFNPDGGLADGDGQGEGEQ